MNLYKLPDTIILRTQDGFYKISQHWDELINRPALYRYLADQLNGFERITEETANQHLAAGVLPPVGSQEVWAAGVTYFSSMEARMEESKESGGADLYYRVYHADRPELFFKSLAHRVAGDKQVVNIRRDSVWNVPEPELALYIDSTGLIQGYTIGNDMSSRSIEGENALYLPQAKVYDRSAALGPCLYVPATPISRDTTISITISRNGNIAYSDSVTLVQMKRSLTELAAYLYRELSFDQGCFLMTGTCLVPPPEFTLAENDIVEIAIEGIGVLTNTIGYKIQN